MLIQFSVENYRSIKGRQTLSMVTSTSNEEKNRCILNTGFKAAPAVLENAAIYGPNGSGKSNLIAALRFFRNFIITSAKGQEGDAISVTPFLFSKKAQKEPSTFEAVFIQGDFLFQYGFVVDQKKVYDEWLYATPKGSNKQKLQTWFERKAGKDSVKKELKGDKAVWYRSTRENALFLSTAVQLNSEDFKIPFSWLKNSLRVLSKPEKLHYNFTAFQILKKGKKERIMEIMKGLDVSFDDIKITEKVLTESDFELDNEIPDIVRKEILKNVVGKKHPEIHTLHKMEEGENYSLPFEDESEGTRQLFAFAGPLLDVLEHGFVLAIDEIHTSLHPLALKGIISLFQNKKINKNNAQLIFTTHDTNSMNYLERDQIWLLDKGETGNTTFTALSEFKCRPNEAIEKRYLGGRYGGLPNIKGIN